MQPKALARFMRSCSGTLCLVRTWRTVLGVLLLAGAPAASSAGTFSTLVNFDGTNGANPLKTGSLIQGIDGNLYGLTYGGGANGRGTFFRITASGTLTTLYSFCAQDELH